MEHLKPGSPIVDAAKENLICSEEGRTQPVVEIPWSPLVAEDIRRLEQCAVMQVEGGQRSVKMAVEDLLRWYWPAATWWMRELLDGSFLVWFSDELQRSHLFMPWLTPTRGLLSYLVPMEAGPCN